MVPGPVGRSHRAALSPSAFDAPGRQRRLPVAAAAEPLGDATLLPVGHNLLREALQAFANTVMRLDSLTRR
jgi:hypothetical protein